MQYRWIVFMLFFMSAIGCSSTPKLTKSDPVTLSDGSEVTMVFGHVQPHPFSDETTYANVLVRQPTGRINLNNQPELSGYRPMPVDSAMGRITDSAGKASTPGAVAGAAASALLPRHPVQIKDQSHESTEINSTGAGSGPTDVDVTNDATSTGTGGTATGGAGGTGNGGEGGKGGQGGAGGKGGGGGKAVASPDIKTISGSKSSANPISVSGAKAGAASHSDADADARSESASKSGSQSGASVKETNIQKSPPKKHHDKYLN